MNTSSINTNVRASGWMHKQGQKRKRWQRRFMVLHNTFIEYFKSEKDVVAKGRILLALAVVYQTASGESDRKHTIALNTPERPFYISLDSEEEALAWLDRIKLAILEINDSMKASATSCPVSPRGTCSMEDFSTPKTSIARKFTKSISGIFTKTDKSVWDLVISNPILVSSKSNREREDAGTDEGGARTGPQPSPRDKKGFAPQFSREEPDEVKIEDESVMHMRVVGAEKQIGFITYTVEIFWKGCTWTIKRRFTQFSDLDGKISHVMSPDYKLPEKTLTRNFDDEFIAKRRSGLNEYVKGISKQFDKIENGRKGEKEALLQFARPSQVGDQRGNFLWPPNMLNENILSLSM